MAEVGVVLRISGRKHIHQRAGEGARQTTVKRAKVSTK